MMIFTKNIKASFIFNILAMLLVTISIMVYTNFIETKKSITHTYDSSTKNYVKDFTSNIKDLLLKNINKDIYGSLKNDLGLRTNLENDLALFVTNRYKYIYLLDKEKLQSNEYRFLLDGSKDLDDKSEFSEPYEPLEVERFNTVYTSKESLFFTHQKVESLWMTYLTPLLIDDEVKAIIVVDFSIEDFKAIDNSLEEFDSSFGMFVLFFIFVFVVIIGFSFLDKKRELQKEKAYTALEIKTKELKDESIKVTYLNNTLEDRVKEEVRKNKIQNQQLIQQSRLAQMGEMISMIAHQWRQPLNSISLTSSNLSFKCMMNDIDKEYFAKELALIDDYSQHLSITIDDFRNFFKADNEKEFVSMDEVVSNTINIIKISLENKNINIKLNLNSKSKFYTYNSQLTQVILNLIKNAEDILLDTQTIDPIIYIESFENDKNTNSTLIIKDNAGGIPSDIIDSIFDPYFSTKKEKDGTGLGLYMSKTIIEDHCHGELNASNYSDGAIFEIILNCGEENNED